MAQLAMMEVKVSWIADGLKRLEVAFPGAFFEGDPSAHVVIGPDARIAPGARILLVPGLRIEGQSRVEAGAEVLGGVIRDSRIFGRVTGGTVVSSTVGRGSSVSGGRVAYTELKEGARISGGEVENCLLHPGAWVSGGAVRSAVLARGAHISGEGPFSGSCSSTP
jgi:hypothetical protein